MTDCLPSAPTPDCMRALENQLAQHLVVDLTSVKKPLSGSILKTPATSTATSVSPSRSLQSVTFKTVIVRDYNLELGDHPSCSYGPPVQLSWEYVENDPMDINLFEGSRRRRNIKHLLLNYYQRRAILLRSGYSEEDMKAATKAAARVQRQRMKSRLMEPVASIGFNIRNAIGQSTKKAKTRGKYS